MQLWTAQEIADLRNGKVPKGRSLKAARQKAFQLKIEFCPIGKKCAMLRLPKEKRMEIALHAGRLRNKSKTALHFGVSRQYVIDCCKEFKIAQIPSPHERLGEHVEYEGHNYSWKKGSWICTAKKVRESGEYNLTKKLWKKYYGIYPDANYDIRYKDGNRYNLRKSNLMLVTKSEGQKIRLKDPKYKSIAYASGILGLLMVRINEQLDPDKKKRRCMKGAETRRPKQGEISRKACESRKRNAEERGYYYTPEARKRMSEAHKGKKRK